MTAMTRSQPAGSMSQKSVRRPETSGEVNPPERRLIPALLTRMWRPPISSMVRWTAWSTDSGSVTSAMMGKDRIVAANLAHVVGGLVEPVIVYVKHGDAGASADESGGDGAAHADGAGGPGDDGDFSFEGDGTR